MFSLETYNVTELKSFFQTILDHIDHAILIADKNGNYLFVNRFVLKYTDTTMDDWLEKTPQDMIDLGIYDKSFVMEAIKSKKETTGMIYTKKGFSSLSVCTPILDQQGNIQSIVTISVNPDRFNSLLERLQEEKQDIYKYEISHLRKTLFYDSEIVYASKNMQEIFDSISKFAPTDSTVLITGESGSGKEVIAKAIHQNSKRKDGPFIPVTIPSIPANLLESELFGYEQGAFTGSSKHGKPGLIELANHGTLFLDELGDIPFELQVKLLRVLDTLEIVHVGAIKPRKLNLRIIAATNKNVDEMVRNGLFREDLLYRLSIINLHLKPLRERREDIVALAEHFMEKLNKKYHGSKQLTRHALRILQSYSWPGNVRELRNIIERAYIMSDHKTLTEEDMVNILGIESHPTKDRQKSFHSSERSILEEYESLERTKILEALVAAGGNKSMAAKILGISRGKLYRELGKTER